MLFDIYVLLDFVVLEPLFVDGDITAVVPGLYIFFPLLVLLGLKKSLFDISLKLAVLNAVLANALLKSLDSADYVEAVIGSNKTGDVAVIFKSKSSIVELCNHTVLFTYKVAFLGSLFGVHAVGGLFDHDLDEFSLVCALNAIKNCLGIILDCFLCSLAGFVIGLLGFVVGFLLRVDIFLLRVDLFLLISLLILVGELSKLFLKLGLFFLKLVKVGLCGGECLGGISYTCRLFQ